ncbi:PucR family transcriptional regulator [Streptomyces sp. NBC_01602]|uniref:PucR family transcriptional regulator n=1 Tax=Streptomyces sp. NBC_01602 TaxID=2975893 RepID=UPI00386C48A2|nr:helix-turn-helix domain-containing protein [Streptomyces sp. NBC_01602]
MSSELQLVADALAARLSRSVAVDDPGLCLLAHTEHTGEVDRQRIESILRRQASPEATAFSHRLGAADSLDVFIEPPAPEIGSTIGRIGMPVRYEGRLLGFIWLLESEGPLTDTVADALRTAAGDAGAILYREHLLGELGRRRERELVHDLLADDPALRGKAAEQAIQEGHLVAGPAVALVVTLEPPNTATPADRHRLGIALGLDHVRRRVPAGHLALHLDRPDHGVLIVTGPHSPPQTLGGHLHERVAAGAGLAGEHCWVGIGGPQAALADVHASYTEALRAARTAQNTRIIGQVVRHDQLGVYRLLTELPANLLRHSLPPGLDRLREHGNASLIHTLEAFLDNAGHVSRTAEQLHISRATLYYRLRRIEEVADINLDNGDDRLAVHIGLKASRLM